MQDLPGRTGKKGAFNYGYTAMSAQPLRRQTLVLVTDQFQCERIIKAGRAIAGITHTQLRVFHICAEGRTSDPAALQYLYNSAKENGSVLGNRL